MRSTVPRGARLMGLLVLVAGGWSSACGAPAERPTPPVIAPHRDTVCTDPSGGPTTPDGSRACVHLTVALDRAPAVGDDAALTVEILATLDRTVRIELDAPRGVDWVAAPSGLVLTRVPDTAPDNGGCLHRAGGTAALTAGRPLRLSGTVRANATGFFTLRARAATVSGGGGGLSTGNVFVTVGRTRDTSFLGYRPPSEGNRAVPTQPIRTSCD